MENGNEKKVKRIINLIIGIIAIILIIILCIIGYNHHLQKVNNNKFTTYLENNNYKKDENNIYTKTIDNGNEKTTYQAIIDQYLLTKEKSTSTDTKFTSITTSFKQDGTIEIAYKLEGYNSEGSVGTLYQKGTYKDDKFDCQIVNNNDFETQCPTMKKEAQEFDKEVKQIFENNDINLKYITLKDKNSTNQ